MVEFSLSPGSEFAEQRTGIGPYFVAIVFAFFGVMMMTFTLKEAYQIRALRTNGEVTFGTVIKADSHRQRDSNGKNRTVHRSYVTYSTLQGDSFTKKFNMRTQVGDQIELIYDPNDPINAISGNKSIKDPLIGAGFGAVFVIIGVLIGAMIWRRRREIDWLLRYGTPIICNVTGINEKIRKRKKGGRTRTYTVTCLPRTPIPQGPETFTSEALTNRPDNGIIGREVEVLINPQDPSRYFVDLKGERSPSRAMS